jgi:hypothetical protein
MDAPGQNERCSPAWMLDGWITWLQMCYVPAQRFVMRPGGPVSAQQRKRRTHTARTYQTTRCNITADQNMHLHRIKNIKISTTNNYSDTFHMLQILGDKITSTYYWTHFCRMNCIWEIK